MSRSYTSSPPSASMACRGTALLYLLLKAVNALSVGEARRRDVTWEPAFAGLLAILLSEFEPMNLDRVTG
jgi:hypothetical protein